MNKKVIIKLNYQLNLLMIVMIMKDMMEVITVKKTFTKTMYIMKAMMKIMEHLLATANYSLIMKAIKVIMMTIFMKGWI